LVGHEGVLGQQSRSVTNKQAEEDSGGRLTRAAVIDAALAVLQDRGLEGVSTRAVTDRLGVRMKPSCGT
jgi:TetR/AcrR family tetracycline transcriptional repressor